jgi:hypothetical protein
VAVDLLSAEPANEEDGIMGKNEGVLDRALRVTVAMVALVAGLAVGAGSVAGIVLLAVAAIMFLTGVVGFCPLYTIFRINTAGSRR